MKPTFLKYVILFLSPLFYFCEYDQLENSNNRKGSHNNDSIKFHHTNLGIPDSIDTQLIVATYYDEESQTHSIILYDDTNKASAKRLTFLIDSIDIDILKPKSEREFISTFNKAEYIVNKSTVTYFYQYFESSTIKHFDRLD
jgi:hypothetical protein